MLDAVPVEEEAPYDSLKMHNRTAEEEALPFLFTETQMKL